MSDHENARRYLLLAERDLQVLKHMTDAEAFPVEVFGFHAQQAVEKALKAWLCMAYVPFRKVHDLALLCRLLKEAGEQVSASFRSLSYLTEFAVELRYGIGARRAEELDRARAVEQVRTLVEFVRRRVEAEG
jgi:HEPN domain-containing protein